MTCKLYQLPKKPHLFIIKIVLKAQHSCYHGGRRPSMHVLGFLKARTANPGRAIIHGWKNHIPRSLTSQYKVRLVLYFRNVQQVSIGFFLRASCRVFLFYWRNVLVATCTTIVSQPLLYWVRHHFVGWVQIVNKLFLHMDQWKLNKVY